MRTSADPAILSSVPLFAGMNDTERERLSRGLRCRSYRARDAIFLAGDPGSSLCVIQSGRVKLSANSPDGREVILDLLGAGEVFGELAVLDGQPRSVDAVAVDPTHL